MFKLSRHFSLTSLLAFVIVTILLGQLYRQTILKELILLGEKKNVALTQAFANSQWPQFAPFITSATGLDAETLRNHPENARLRQSIFTQMHNVAVVKVKIYNLDGVTVFSTDNSQIGTDYSQNPEFRAARNGHIVSDLVKRNEFHAFEETLEDRSLIYTYIPIRQKDQTSKIEGVFELYSDVTPLLQRIERAERHVFSGVIIILGVLYIALFLIVKRADTIIFQQSSELRKLSQAVEQSANTVVITDAQGNIEYVNPKFVETTGYTQEEAKGENLRILKSGEQDHTLYKELWATILSGREWYGEFHNKRKDGSLYWEYATITPMHDTGGNITHFIAVKEDITERKRAESALRESQRQLEELYQREQTRRKSSDTLREIAKIVSSTLEQDKVLDLILAQLGHVIAYQRATVSLLEGHTLTLVAGHDKMGRTTNPYTFVADKYPINAQVLTSKKPVLIPDVADDERWYPTSTMEGVRSFICAPLLVQDQLIGLLAVGSPENITYTTEDTQTVFAFATQVAIAMRNAQLHAQAQERNRRLALLHEISLAVNSTVDLYTLLTIASQKLVENFHIDHSGMLLFDETDTYGEVMAEYPPKDAMGIRLPLKGHAANEQLIETAQPLAIYDAQHDPLMKLSWDVMRNLGIQSILLVPLVVKGRVIGSFSLDSMTTQRHFTTSEIELVQTIASQLAMVIDNARLLERERALIEQELQMAQHIQLSLLPTEVPRIPGLDIAGISQPAREVGGDFYNFIIFDSKHVGIAVGDVSGKGMQAALMMALSFGLFTTEVRRAISPSDLLNTLNTELRPHIQQNKMNTALGYLTFTPSDNGIPGGWDLCAANAGLIAPLVKHRDGTVDWLDVTGLPLGMIEHTDYTELRYTLSPGDLIILSSDGIVEAMNAEGELYGFERLAESVAATKCHTAETLIHCILHNVRDFLGDVEMRDDLTMVVIMVNSLT